MTTLTPLVAESIQVLKDAMLIPANNDEERDAAGGTPFRMTFGTLSNRICSANIDLTQEMLDKVSNQKILGKKQRLESKLEKEREHQMAILESYPNGTLKVMEETCF